MNTTEHMAKTGTAMRAYFSPVTLPFIPSPRREGILAPRLATLRIGLSYVKNLAKTARSRILAERSRAFFLSLEDFLDRAKLTLPEAEALADSGALDSFGLSRPEIMWRIRLHRASAPVSLLGAPPVILPALRDLPPGGEPTMFRGFLDQSHSTSSPITASRNPG
jgi:DNA polymerase III alpha subunit